MTVTPDYILNKAVSNVQRALNLDPSQIAPLLNIGTECFARLSTDGTLVLPEEEREVAVDLVRIYQALLRFVGGDEEQMLHWISVGNRAFDDERPRNLLASADGVVRVRDYCEAMVENNLVSSCCGRIALKMHGHPYCRKQRVFRFLVVVSLKY